MTTIQPNMMRSGLPINLGKCVGPDGPKVLQIAPMTFTGASSGNPVTYTLDIQKEFYGNQIDQIQGIYYDNTANGRSVVLTFDSTNQTLELPAQSAGYLPVLALMNGNLQITSTGYGTFGLWFLNCRTPELVSSLACANAYANDASGAGTGASVQALPANPNRTGLIISNGGATSIAINFGAANPAVIGGAGSITIPTATPPLTLGIGICPLDAVNVIATLAANYTIKELTA